jgi:hypothetical protein
VAILRIGVVFVLVHDFDAPGGARKFRLRFETRRGSI